MLGLCGLSLICAALSGARPVLSEVDSFPVPDYDERTALALAEYCSIAYSCAMPDGCSDWLCPGCTRHPDAEFLRFRSGFASGIVGYDYELRAIIIAWAGTSMIDVAAWLNNIRGELIQHPICTECQVHRGFDEAFTSVRPHMRRQLSYVLSRHASAPIWVTGHSLGGALATLTVADLYSNHSLPVQLTYTFGSPRVGNPAFANYIQYVALEQGSAFYRIVHGKDPVPHTPPVLLGFWHTPIEIFYNEAQSEYKICDGSGEDFYCSNSYLFSYDVKDHLRYFNVTF